MSNDENKFQPIFQILHVKSAWFLLELAMALVTTIGMRFLQVWLILLLQVSSHDFEPTSIILVLICRILPAQIKANHQTIDT